MTVLLNKNLMLIRAVFICLTILFAGSGANAQAIKENPASNDKSVPSLEKIIIDGREAEALWLVTAQGRFRFTAEIADTNEERSTGLMFRETMNPTHGMLFDFKTKRLIQMWMRNTPLSLDMVFVHNNGVVAHIAERTTPFSDNIINSLEPVTHVLEINAGVSKLIGLRAGDVLEHPMFIKP